MGYGDKLMAIGDAAALYDLEPRKVAIGDGRAVDWCQLSDGLPFLASQAEVDQGEDVQWVHSYPSCRPYIDYAAMAIALRQNGMLPPRKNKHLVKLLGRYIWKADYRPKPAQVIFTETEQRIAEEWSKEPFVCVEPFIKPRAPVNKQWGLPRYRELIRRLSRNIKVVQLSAPVHNETFPGAVRVRPTSFHEAIAYLKASKGYVGAEGGLHHAAAAVGTPAIVMFGGFVDPLVTGYDFHVNLTGGADHFCGTRYGTCPHCRTAMENITVPQVLEQTTKLLLAR